ncbi:hypothetical protein [Pseudoneobacillus sp. C159]
MGKAKVAIIVAAIFLFIGFAIWHPRLEPKTIGEFYPGNITNVDKITILDGSTGERRELNEGQEVQQWLNKIKAILYVPDENQEERVGFLYSVAFYEKERMTFSFTHNQVDNDYYHPEPDIIPIMKEMFESANKLK